MLKKDEAKLDSCWNRANDDEQVFILLARDRCAPETIRAWCRMRVGDGSNRWTDQKIKDALRCADEMEHQQHVAVERSPINDLADSLSWMEGK